MSCIPAFEIGLWNAWILMLYVPLLSPIMKVVDKIMPTSEIYKKLGGDVAYQNGEKKASAIYTVIQLVLLVYSIFLPLKLGTLWFYAGITLYLVGVAILIAALSTTATTPLGKPFTQGIYRYSRHPGYLSLFITFVAISVASASWFFLLLSVISIFLQNTSVIAEERACLEIFGGGYEQYMKRTPKWMGIPKST